LIKARIAKTRFVRDVKNDCLNDPIFANIPIRVQYFGETRQKGETGSHKVRPLTPVFSARI